MVDRPTSYSDTLDLQYKLPVGWKLHGCGFYSVVIGRADSDKVYKMVYRGRDQWPEYAEYAFQNHSTNHLLPRIHRMFRDDDKAIAVIERLYESGVYHSVGMSDVIKLCRNQGFTTRFKTPTKRRTKVREYLRERFDIRGNRNYNPTNLADIVLWVAGKPDMKADFHGRNWMMRQTGQLVLTDPIG